MFKILAKPKCLNSPKTSIFKLLSLGYTSPFFQFGTSPLFLLYSEALFGIVYQPSLPAFLNFQRGCLPPNCCQNFDFKHVLKLLRHA